MAKWFWQVVSASGTPASLCYSCKNICSEETDFFVPKGRNSKRVKIWHFKLSWLSAEEETFCCYTALSLENCYIMEEMAQYYMKSQTQVDNKQFQRGYNLETKIWNVLMKTVWTFTILSSLSQSTCFQTQFKNSQSTKTQYRNTLITQWNTLLLNTLTRMFQRSSNSHELQRLW